MRHLPGSPPILSVVVPTYNEEAGIATSLAQLTAALPTLVASWEIVVADDGSEDRTRAIVEDAAGRDQRIRLLTLPHRGKGATVRDGLLQARGAWRFMADADLSMPPEDLDQLLAPLEQGAADDLVIGSREAAGAVRIDEPFSRYVVGRVFNVFVRLVAVPGLRDTQCGFKLFSARAVTTICPHLKTDGFAFDVELLFLARRAGFGIREVGVTWRCRQDSRVAVSRGAWAFLDVVRLRTRAWRGEYAAMPVPVLPRSHA